MSLLCGGWHCICTHACIGKALLCYCRPAPPPPPNPPRPLRHSPVRQHVHALLDVWCVTPPRCTSANYHSTPRPRRCPSTDGCLIMTMSVMNAINLKWESGSHEEIKMTPLLAESFPTRKQDSVLQRGALERSRQGFISVSGLFHTFATDFLFIYNWRESHTVHSPRCIPYHTQHYYGCCLNSILSGACVSFFCFSHTVLSVLFSQACYF